MSNQKNRIKVVVSYFESLSKTQPVGLFSLPVKLKPLEVQKWIEDLSFNPPILE